MRRARVGREHSKLQSQQCVAKIGNPAGAMRPLAMQCTAASSRKQLSGSVECDAAQLRVEDRTAMVTLDAGDGLLGRSGNEHRWEGGSSRREGTYHAHMKHSGACMRSLTNARRALSLSENCSCPVPHASSLRKTWTELAVFAISAAVQCVRATPSRSHVRRRNVSTGAIQGPCSSAGPLATARRSCASDHVRDTGLS